MSQHDDSLAPARGNPLSAALMVALAMALCMTAIIGLAGGQ
ncbi:hypothetical protein [Magnetofaba australis]|nr:hypothetical protein [Magnetofaba australis]